MAEAASLEEVWKLFREIAAVQQRTAAAQERTEAQQDKTALDIKALGRYIDEVGRRIDEVGRRVDALTGKWGRFVEGLIVPAAEWLFAERGIPVHTVSQRVRSRRHGGEMEIGVLVVNQGHVVLIEAKSTLGADDVNEHLDRIACFKDFFPEYADRQVLGAVAGIEITGDADKYAYRKGLFVIAQSGDGVKILNDARFRPRTW